MVTYFHQLIREYPVFLFIDGLDQLTDENQRHSQISFLTSISPHPDSRIVVYCLPNETEINLESGLTYMYSCETRLKIGQVPRVIVEMSEDLVWEEAMKMVDKL